MRGQIERRLSVLEESDGGGGRIRYMFRWSSQDHKEALARWKAALSGRGWPLLPGEETYCVVWQDTDGRHKDDWRLLDARSHRSECLTSEEAR